MQPDTAQLAPPALLAQVRDGNYLAPVVELERLRAPYLASEEWRSSYLDLSATVNAFVGNYAQAHALFDHQSPPPAPPPAAPSAAGLRRHDAIDAVRAAGRAHRVVLLNEAHHVPQHRAFAIEVLQALHAEGFRYLAVESVTDFDTALVRRGYPVVMRTGLYVSEPVFGDLVRTALKLGMKVVPYDARERCQPREGDPMYCANRRDSVQAANLNGRILAHDPAARVLVYAGYGHVLKRARGGWVPMAVRFAELTGIEPFSIDQTVMTEHSSPGYEHPLYQALAGGLESAAVFEDASAPGRWVARDFDVDMQVFHPRSRYRDGRPDWLRMGGARHAVRIYGDGMAPPAPYLVQAFYGSEPADAVPADQVAVARDGAVPVLVLPPGHFRLRTLAPDGRVVSESAVEIPRAAARARPALR